MSKEKENFDRKQKRTKKIMGLVVAPILFMVAGLLAIGNIDFEGEKPTQIEILSTMDVHCYNVNWFGTQGFQIIYNETLEEYVELLDENDMDFTGSEFYDDQEIIGYLVIHCPHVDSRLVVPDNFDPNLGMNAFDKCFEWNLGMLQSEDLCLEFKA